MTTLCIFERDSRLPLPFPNLETLPDPVKVLPENDLFYDRKVDLFR
jgi:hypothetical protein